MKKLRFNSFSHSCFSLIKHDGIEHAGYLAFLLMLSIFPFLIFFVAITGLITNSYMDLVNTLQDLILESELANFVDALKPRIVEITHSPPQSLLTIAILSAIWTASSIFEALRTILNRAYMVIAPPSYLFRRLVSFIEFAVVAIITSLIMFTLLIVPYVVDFFSLHFFFDTESFIIFVSKEIQIARRVIMAAFGFFLIAGLYCFLPNKKIKFHETFPGTIIVMLCWYSFSYLFKYYITYFPQINFIYGSIAGVIVALLYFYVCSLIFIYGAEFNYHLYYSDQKSNIFDK